jgi:hypothetical protein
MAPLNKVPYPRLGSNPPDWEPVEPGQVPVTAWRSSDDSAVKMPTGQFVCAVARKPQRASRSAASAR